MTSYYSSNGFPNVSMAYLLSILRSVERVQAADFAAQLSFARRQERNRAGGLGGARSDNQVTDRSLLDSRWQSRSIAIARGGGGYDTSLQTLVVIQATDACRGESSHARGAAKMSELLT